MGSVQKALSSKDYGEGKSVTVSHLELCDMRYDSNEQLISRGNGSPRIRFGPSGIHLFHRSSGLNVLIDEIVPPERVWSAAPRQISIALTNICDLTCSFCFAPKIGGTLDFEKITGWLDELNANGTLGVGFGGGEPTLYRRFAELCSYATRNTGLAVTFTTHGHRLDGPMLKELEGNINFVRISMDGINDTYERLRGRSFKVLRERIQAINKMTAFGINYLVNSDTISEIDAAADFAQESNAAEFLLLPEQATNGREGMTATTAKTLRNWVARYSGSMRLAVSSRGVQGMPVCDPFVRESGTRSYAHVDANGLLKHSSYDTEGIVIGSGGIMSCIQKLLRHPRG